jgi:hypothetical protein
MSYEMQSRDWLLKQLGMTEEQLYSSCRQRDLVNKRWVMMWFYRAAGKSFPYVGNKMKRNHATVVSACKKLPPSVKALAEEMLFEYITQVLGEKTDFEPAEKPKVKIKVPDYHNNITKFVEVDKDSIKPQRKIRKWDL